MYETLPIVTSHFDTFSISQLTMYFQSLFSSFGFNTSSLDMGMNRETMAMLGYSACMYAIYDSGNKKRRRR
jgi:hypothetical protein